VRREAYEPPPENTPRDLRELISGVYKLDGALLLVLDTDRALQVQTIQ
jgi:purine-binding chemotaxis protein CheW